ncbi:MAG: TIGR03618 family F420-dependent PPOX class oxidoreductase [Microthrixaceae bacterium]
MSEPVSLSTRAQEIFRSKAFAHVAVPGSGGVPHTTPVWADVDDDGNLWFNTAIGRFKERHLQLGDPVAVSATDPDNPYEYCQVRGHVGERRTDGAEEDIDALAKKYMGVDTYPLRTEGERRVTIVVTPTSTTGV